MPNDPAESRVGTVLCGRYRLDRVLGAGGMAVVYAASHVRNRQWFAIKMLHLEASFDSEIRTRFLREGYVANSVRHKGAVKVIDDDVAEDGSAFLVMELLEGQTVEQAWERHGGRLEPRVVLAIGDQLLDALAAAHESGIVHRDIKPANLFLTHEGAVKVLDFGIARLRDTGAAATQTGTTLGTPAFMAPEQASGRTSEIDARTDIWAAGATMFTLLSGQTVHQGETGREVAMRAAMYPARSLATAVPEALPNMVALVDRALAYDRAQRWASAAEMRNALRELHLADYGVEPSDAPLRALFVPLAISATLVHPEAERGPSHPVPGPGPARVVEPAPAPRASPSQSYVPSTRTLQENPVARARGAPRWPSRRRPSWASQRLRSAASCPPPYPRRLPRRRHRSSRQRRRPRRR